MKGKGTLFLFLIILFNSSLSQSLTSDVLPVFKISLLSPASSTQRHQWAFLMKEELPKIGIGIDIHDQSVWPSIYSRTWSYPVGEQGYYDYIPTYEQGGFDVFFVDWVWGLDWLPFKLFHSTEIPPNGWNLYQYSNPDCDILLEDYMSEFNPQERKFIVQDVQQILYEDLPSIPIINPGCIFGIKESLTNIDAVLLSVGKHRAEYWDDSDDHIINYASPVEFYDPHVFSLESYYDSLWMQSVYGGLFQRAHDFHFYDPVVALDYTVSSDSLQFNVTINSSAKFSNGNPVLAEDIKYTYDLHFNPEIYSSNRGLLEKYLINNDSVVILDTHNIQFNFNQASFLAFEVMSCGIIEKSTVEPLISTYGYGIFNEYPLTGNVGNALVTSCGPFKLSSFSLDNTLVELVPNVYYHRKQPYVSEIAFKFVKGKDTAILELKNGNVDIVDSNYIPMLEDYKGVSGIQPLIVPSFENNEIAINLKHPILGTGELTPVGTAEAANNVRKAISHIVPRQMIIDELLEGVGSPAVTPIPKGCIGFDDSLNPYEYNLELAKMYMEQAGYVLSTETTSTTSSSHTTISLGSSWILIICIYAIVVVVKVKKTRK